MFREFTLPVPRPRRLARPAIEAGRRQLLFGFRVDHYRRGRAPQVCCQSARPQRRRRPRHARVQPAVRQGHSADVWCQRHISLRARQARHVDAAAHRRRPTAQLALQHAPPAPRPGRPSASALQPRPASGPIRQRCPGWPTIRTGPVSRSGITPAINARLVSFPFKRDTCKLPAGAAASDFGPDGFHGLVRHSRAVVTVSCVNAWELGPGADECPPGSTPPLPGELGKGGRICSATLPAPGCDLQLHLATSLCPQPVRKTELKCGSTSCVSRVAGPSRNAGAAVAMGASLFLLRVSVRCTLLIYAHALNGWCVFRCFQILSRAVSVDE